MTLKLRLPVKITQEDLKIPSVQAPPQNYEISEVSKLSRCVIRMTAVVLEGPASQSVQQHYRDT